MIMAIEREWSQRPGWLSTLDRDDVLHLIADWRARHEPAKP